MESSIFRFIWRHSKKQQLVLLVFTLASFPFLYFTLDLPKIIINEAIGGKDFPKTFVGIELGQINYLLSLCGIFLALVLVNGGFKLWINIYRGVMGERMLRRLRYILFARVLRFPRAQFNKLSQGEIIAMIAAEVEPLGGYIGEAVSLPVFQGGTLLTILVFIIIQDPYLGIAAIALYPVQMYLIPKLQMRVNELGRQRVRAARKLSENIGETVSGIQEIHAHDTSAWERANVASHLGLIFDIRYQIYKRKFFIKFLNNFISQLTPFFFYSLGGILVIKGNMSFGALVAVIAAYKDLAPPWKELLKHYQTAMDAMIKYEQLSDQFEVHDLLDKKLQLDPPAELMPVEGDFHTSNVVVEDDTGFKILDGLSLDIPVKGTTAILGAADSGRDHLARLLMRLIKADKGGVKLGGMDADNLHEAIIGHNLAYVDHSAYVFGGSVLDNLLYGLKHRPVHEATHDAEIAALRDHHIQEAEKSGNSTDDIDAEWIDFDNLELDDDEAFDRHILQVMTLTRLAEDVQEFGLKARISPQEHGELSKNILKARLALKSRLSGSDMKDLVEPFDKDLFNDNMSVGENILMGHLVTGIYDFSALGSDPYMLSILDKAGMRDWFLQTGLKVAETMVELFQDLPPGHEFFERFSFIEASELPEFQVIIRKVSGDGLENLSSNDKARLRGLPFMLTPARHRLDLVTDEVRGKILECRRAFAENLPKELDDAIEFYDEALYNAGASIQDNILFGKIAHGRARARRKIGQAIEEVIDELGLNADIFKLGLDMPVGVAGGRLSAAQRQKLCLARALLKKPVSIILNNPLSALDPATQLLLMKNIIGQLEGRGLIWVLNRPKDAKHFDNVIVMKEGRVEQLGPPDSILKE